MYRSKKGESLVDFGGNPDKKCIITYGAFAKLFQSGRPDPDIVVKAKESDEGMKEVEAEVIGLMRTKRGIKPRDENNFSINKPEAAAQAVSGLFSVLSLGGLGDRQFFNFSRRVWNCQYYVRFGKRTNEPDRYPEITWG